MIKVGPSTQLCPLQDLIDLFDFSPEGARAFLATLRVPLHPYPNGEFFSRFALETALFVHHMLPEIKETSRKYKETQYKVPHDPAQIATLMALASVMYGNEEEKGFRARLKLLGDQLLKGALRDGRVRYRAPKDRRTKDGRKNDQ